ncbi:class I SAM-dependent methyltransferase [Nanoarchaeota archaeon]
MAGIPKGSELGSSSFYGTEKNLKEVLARYKVHPADSDFYIRTHKGFLGMIKGSMREGDVVLDVGCSFGFVTCEIAALYREAGLNMRLVGIDIDPRQISNAKAYSESVGIDGIEYHVCDARSLESLFSPEEISMVVSLYAFHHIPDAEEGDINQQKRDVLKTLQSLCSEGARIIIGDVIVPSSYSDRRRYKDELERDWMPLRLEAAQRVSDAAFEMEKNATLGVLNRENEFPITLDEYREILSAAGWVRCSEKVIEPYMDVILNYKK